MTAHTSTVVHVRCIAGYKNSPFALVCCSDDPLAHPNICNDESLNRLLSVVNEEGKKFPPAILEGIEVFGL